MSQGVISGVDKHASTGKIPRIMDVFMSLRNERASLEYDGILSLIARLCKLCY